MLHAHRTPLLPHPPSPRPALTHTRRVLMLTLRVLMLTLGRWGTTLPRIPTMGPPRRGGGGGGLDGADERRRIINMRQVYVSGFPFNLDSEGLGKLFNDNIGGVTRAYVMMQKSHEGGSLGYGFVLFDDSGRAEQAIDQMDGYELHGRTLSVRPRVAKAVKGAADRLRNTDLGRDRKPPAQADNRARQVYINNVPFTTSKQDITDLFNGEQLHVELVTMPMKSVEVNGQPEMVPAGYGFVTFEDEASVQRAIDLFDGHELNGRVLSVNRRTGDGAQRARNREEQQEKQIRRNRDEERRQVYVSRFPLDCSKEELEGLFAFAGDVEGVHLPVVLTATPEGEKRMSKGWAFVTFGDVAAVDRALELNGENVRGSRLQVRRRAPAHDSGDDVKKDIDSHAAPSSQTEAAAAPLRAKSKDKKHHNDLEGIDVEALQRQFLQDNAPAKAEAPSPSPDEEAGNEVHNEADEARPQDAPEEVPTQEAQPASGGKGADEPAATAERVAAAAVPQPRRSGRQSKQRQQADAKEVRVSEGMSIKDCAEALGVRLVDVVKCLIRLGEEPKTVEHSLSLESAEFVISEFGGRAILPEGAESSSLGRRFTDEEYQQFPRRSPIVTIMGHVDHGKTTLLDYLRSSSVASGEAGGITQSIAAFEVDRPGLGKICFVDTPGHQAFSAMRERGAKATDIVILVVSAVDGVQPQTIEVIQHARTAQVPLIIAVNKCDLPSADPGFVLSELAMHGVVVEELGGDVQHVNVSGLTGDNVDKLEESVLLLSEMMELRAPPDGPGEGFVVEARKDKSLGPVASLIVTLGQLKKGDHVVVGSEWGRVRLLRDSNRDQVDAVGPSSVCEVTGFRGQPAAGQELYVVDSEKSAVMHAERFALRRAAAARAGSGESMQASTEDDGQGLKELPIVVKADVDGSLEALVAAIGALPSREVAVTIVHADIGPCTEHDLDVAEAAGAHVYTFNCKDPTAAVTKIAKHRKIDIFSSKIIYRVLEEVEARMIDMLPSDVRTEVLGDAEVLQTFEIKGKAGQPNTLVAGCRVNEGMMKAGAELQIMRDGEIVHEGKLTSLRNHKEVVKQISSGNECGIVVENFETFEKGDMIQCIEKVVSKRTSLE